MPLTIPLGSAAAAQATQNVYLNGNLTPTGDIANTAEVIDSEILGDATIPRPDVNAPGDPTTVAIAAKPSSTGVTGCVVRQWFDLRGRRSVRICLHVPRRLRTGDAAILHQPCRSPSAPTGIT